MASTAAVALPNWANAWSVNTWPKKYMALPDELLAAVADTFIPTGDEPGALGLEVPQFLQRLFTECYTAAEQEKLGAALAHLQNEALENHQKSWIACTQAEREQLLLQLKAHENKNLSDAYKTLRTETIRGYVTSSYVMLNHYGYQMAPGYYNGCVNL